MSSIYSENSTHRTNLANAERTRQAGITPTSTQAQIMSVEIAYYRSCLNSAIANNCNPGEFVEAARREGIGECLCPSRASLLAVPAISN
jgi:hypothetical protein